MKIRLRLADREIYLYCDSPPKPGDEIELGMWDVPVKDENETILVQLTTLRCPWKTDEDGVLVPTYEARKIT